MFFFIAGHELKAIFFQKEIPALVLSPQLFKFLTTTFFNTLFNTLTKSIIIRNVDQISIAIRNFLHSRFLISGCDDNKAYKAYKVMTVKSYESKKNH